jgi:hypothetical protein
MAEQVTRVRQPDGRPGPAGSFDDHAVCHVNNAFAEVELTVPLYLDAVPFFHVGQLLLTRVIQFRFDAYRLGPPFVKALQEDRPRLLAR